MPLLNVKKEKAKSQQKPQKSEGNNNHKETQLLPLINNQFLQSCGCSFQTEQSITPYQDALMKMHNDEEWQKDFTIDRRIGFYQIKSEIGTGTFSHVKMAIHCLTGEKVALKILDKSKINNKVDKMIIREIILMQKLDHFNIIKIYEVMETLSKIYIVMEYAKFGELFERVNIYGKLDEDQAKVIFLQIVSAVEYLHNHKIIHRDIKSQNVFFADKLTVKLGDFGFSVQLNEKMELLSTFCGSPSYAAPELFDEQKYIGQYVDIWALGVLLYYMVTARLPFNADTVHALKKLILQGEYLIPNYLSEDCQSVIKGLLQHLPENRLSLSQVKNASWFNHIKYPETLENIYDTFKSDKAMVDKMKTNPEDVTETFNILSKMGINKQMIEDNIEKGVRSNVIGIYRIILHRAALNRFYKSFDEVMLNDNQKRRNSKLDYFKSFKSKSSRDIFRSNSANDQALINRTRAFSYSKGSRKICKIM